MYFETASVQARYSSTGSPQILCRLGSELEVESTALSGTISKSLLAWLISVNGFVEDAPILRFLGGWDGWIPESGADDEGVI